MYTFRSFDVHTDFNVLISENANFDHFRLENKTNPNKKKVAGFADFTIEGFFLDEGARITYTIDLAYSVLSNLINGFRHFL